MLARVPPTAAYRIEADTWLIPNLMPAGPDAFLGVNSMVILGEQPVVVDTGAPAHHDSWFEQLLSLVEPTDVRWIYLSHDDGDHVGNLPDLLEMCPNATVVANFFMTERMSIEHCPLPLERLRWLGPGEALDAGDRRLHLVVPPIFDGPTTRALYDERSGVLWSVDSFAAMTPGAVFEVDDIPRDMYAETFALLNSLVSPWHQWLDVARYRRHCDDIESLGPVATASAHGPVLRGAAIADAFERVRAMAGTPVVEPPGQPVLEQMIAASLIPVQP